MGSKRIYEHAQNLLGGVKREVGKLILGGRNLGLHCIILNWVTFKKNYNVMLQVLYYIIIIYYVQILY